MVAMRVMSVTVGSPRPGGWCEPCALPSLVEFDVLTLSLSGVSQIGVYRICADCKERR